MNGSDLQANVRLFGMMRRREVEDYKMACDLL